MGGGSNKMQLSWCHEICENWAPYFCSKICSNILVISAIPRVYHARNSRDLFCSAPRLGGIQFPDFLETTKLMDSSYQTCTSRDINITIHSHIFNQRKIEEWKLYDSFSDVWESRVWFASKNLTPCRMHWNAFLIAQIIAKCHSFPNMYGML